MEHTTARRDVNAAIGSPNHLLSGDDDFVRNDVRGYCAGRREDGGGWRGQGVSTCKVKKITGEPCGYRFSASMISNIVKRLDGQLLAFARQRLDEPIA